MNTTGIIVYPNSPIAMTLAVSANIKSVRKTVYTGAMRYPKDFFFNRSYPEIKDAGKRIDRSSA